MRVQSLAVILSASASCGGTPVLHFQVGKDIAPQTIQSSIAPCQLAIVFPFLTQPLQVTFSQSTDFPEQNTDVNHIKKAKLHSLSLTLTMASAEPNWDFLESLEIYVEAQDLPRLLVASIGAGTESDVAIPDSATTLSLVPNGVNLAPYVKAAGGFTLTSEATGCPPAQDAEFTGRVVLNITADPL